MTAGTQSPFDAVAASYDKDFSFSWAGSRQRERVWKKLDRTISSSLPLSILELNCGTGIDALRFVAAGHTVLATDISSGMIQVAQEKKKQTGIQNLSFLKCDMNNLSQKISGQQFDIIFSNFGGLNCLSPAEVSSLSIDLSALLKKQGRLIAIVMGRHCLWEKLYFTIKSNKKEANRRKNPEFTEANVGDATQKVWYYSPKELSCLFKGGFTKQSLSPIGLFIPPSYLDKSFSEYKILRSAMQVLENSFGEISFLSDYADHYMIEFVRN